MYILAFGQWPRPNIKGGPEPSNFEDWRLVNVSVKYFSKLCFGTSRFQLNWNILKPFLKSSPLDFSRQRLGNTTLVVFLRFHSFSLVVKWPELHWYIKQIFWRIQRDLSSADRWQTYLRKVAGSIKEPTKYCAYKGFLLFSIQDL